MVAIARLMIAVAAAGVLAGCAQTSSPAAQSSYESQGSILVGSTPAAGSTVQGPINELVLNFDPPARLMEVTVTGAEGTIPTMITPVGEVSRYTVPLPGLEAGSYRVDWRASAGGKSHRGSFGFQVQ
ncbi:MAG: copper resistance CopC family protein [Alphaproteobacteria bacterium]